jgi:hypothetical protein
MKKLRYIALQLPNQCEHIVLILQDLLIKK